MTVRRWEPAAYPVLLVLLTLLQVVVPRRSGPLAVSQVFAPWLLFLREHGIAVVRIDRILGGPGVVPTSFRTDCAFHGSDHCVLAG